MVTVPTPDVVVCVVVLGVVVVGPGVAHEDAAKSPEPEVEQTSVPQQPVTVVAGYCVPPFAL